METLPTHLIIEQSQRLIGRKERDVTIFTYSETKKIITKTNESTFPELSGTITYFCCRIIFSTNQNAPLSITYLAFGATSSSKYSTAMVHAVCERLHGLRFLVQTVVCQLSSARRVLSQLGSTGIHHCSSPVAAPPPITTRLGGTP